MQHITYELIQKSIRSILLVAAIVTFLPFVGFGAYINESNPKQLKCIRYRDATGATNNAYSIFFMVFGEILHMCFIKGLRSSVAPFHSIAGSLLCVVIVVCNLFVARVLWIIGRSRTTKRHMNYNLVGREKSIRSIDAESSSGTTLYQAQYSTGSGHHNLPPPRQFHHSNSVTMTAATSPDEIKFAKLMAFLSLSFVLCWMPQMVRRITSISIQLTLPSSHRLPYPWP